MQARRVIPISAAFAAFAAVIILAVSVSGGVPEALVGGPRAVAEGDEVTVHVRIYDTSARLLYSTASADRARLEATAAAFDGPFTVPDLEKDNPSKALAARLVEPVKLDNSTAFTMTSSLVGRRIGDSVPATVLGAFEGYTETVRLARHRGPFPATITASTATLDTLLLPTEGGGFRLDDSLPVRVLAREGPNTTIALDVAEGDRLPIRQTPFHATVHREEGADAFSLHLDATAGDAFTLLKPCKFARYVLPVGSYRVEEISPEEIVLAKAATRWPQLIGRPIIMVLEILDVQDKE